MNAPADLRIGHGFDVHPFSDDPLRPLVLGGVQIDGSPGLAGNSDADAVAHAIADALLGAAGLGDIGQHFPDTGPDWKGADSMRILAATVDLVASAGWNVVNVDTTVVLEAPKLAPVRARMAATLSGVVRAPVSVKAKRAEQLGAIGRREGIACFAVALLCRSATSPGSGWGSGWLTGRIEDWRSRHRLLASRQGRPGLLRRDQSGQAPDLLRQRQFSGRPSSDGSAGNERNT